MDNPNKVERPETNVGYCNPPQHSRFKKGHSGNPEGRPKGTRNIGTVLEKILREKVIINENGKRKTVTKLEAAIKQVANKAASGDLKALQLLAALVRSSEERTRQATSEVSSVDETDEKVVMGILKRLEASRGERPNETAA
jgi:hypothetical protein